MPNHFHFCVQPFHGGDLSAWLHWLMTTHVRTHHARYRTQGHIWQGRYKAFPIQGDDHLLTVLRYVERNPLRAGLVQRAQDWRYSSLSTAKLTSPWPIEQPADWRAWVETDQTEAELEAVRRCTWRGAPFGDAVWVQQTAQALGLGSSLRPLGRPARRRRGELLASEDR